MTLAGRSKYKEDIGELAKVLIAELIFGDKIRGFEVVRGDAFLRCCWYYQCPRDVKSTSVVIVYDSGVAGTLRTYKFHSICAKSLILEYMPVTNS